MDVVPIETFLEVDTGTVSGALRAEHDQPVVWFGFLGKRRVKSIQHRGVHRISLFWSGQCDRFDGLIARREFFRS